VAQYEIDHWRHAPLLELWRWPLPFQAHSLLNRLMVRGVLSLTRRYVATVDGLEKIGPQYDPYILVANHCTRREALALPALLMLVRGGKPVHFLGDWNFLLIPGVSLLYRSGGVITVARKNAKPRFLNIFRRRYQQSGPPLEQARQHLLAGKSIGIFPEGTTNRQPQRLLRGRSGAARLALETGVLVVPVGIRNSAPPGKKVKLQIVIGDPLAPPPMTATASLEAVCSFHECIMRAIAQLSGKTWTGTAVPAEDASHSPVAAPLLSAQEIPPNVTYSKPAAPTQEGD